MSWHGRGGKPDPFRIVVKIGEVVGCFQIMEEKAPDPHYGVRVRVVCINCHAESIRVLTQLRHAAKKGGALTHRGCTR